MLDDMLTEEKNNESLYEVQLVDGVLTVGSKLAYAIQSNELFYKKFEEDRKVYREILEKAMREHGVDKIENDLFIATLIPETVKVSLDAQKVKQEHEEVFIACQKKSSVKGYVKIVTK